MRESLRNRVEEEYAKCKTRLKHPEDLMTRSMSDQDFMDTAVVGGISISDIVSGKFHEYQVPTEVKHAFNLQYPNVHEGFVSAVQRLSPHADQLRGLVNGVRGKLFEINYVDWLNHGHLPVGYTAQLAGSANNPAWDVAIRDHSGHINQVLQLKASAAMSAALESLRHHPDIDVVIPHDLLEHFSAHPEVVSHLVDGHTTLSALQHTVSDGVMNAEAAEIAFHLPYLAFGFIAITTYAQYRTGKISWQEALSRAAERTFLAVAATTAGFIAQTLLHKTIIGIPAAIATRVYLGRWLKRGKLRRVLNTHYEVLRDSQGKLLLVARRPLLLS